MPTIDDSRKARLAAFNARIRACRKCHAAGFLEDRESLPVAFDAEADAPMPRLLLIGQAPGLSGSTADRPFAGAAGDRLRAWLDEVITLVDPEIVILVGLLAIRTALGPVPSLSAVVGTARTIEGVRYLP